MHIRADADQDETLRLAFIVTGLRRLSQQWRADRDRRRTLRQIRKLPAVVGRDIGLSRDRCISRNELSYQFYSFD